MSDNINFNQTTGKHSFFSRGPAWHNLGQNVSEAQTWEQAMQLAGLDWEVIKMQLNHPVTGQPIEAWGTFRSDTNDFFGTVGSLYHPIQNKYQFDFVDSLLEMENGAHYETAGALGKGERVFCLAKIGEGFDVHGIGDKHEVYLLFTTAHDGSGSAKVFLTTVRVVCQNTLRMALTKDGKNALSIRHTPNADEKLAQAKTLIGAERVNEQELRRKLEILAERKLRRANIEDILTRLFPNDEKTKKPTPQAVTTITGILERFESNDNDAFPEIRGTAYNLVNAFTEYTDHFKPVRVTEDRKSLTEKEIRSENALFGKGADFKNSVLDTILEQTKYCETRTITRSMVTVPGGASVIELEKYQPNNRALLDEILDSAA